nr:immunoglobulin light chain junction region [Macaca mulatta]MOV66100.1 immunoglobulin light chain junction region [Macaca mulatta]MOV66995.1 immunoglobulin light chain junction region [Macaca mulatta]MOV67554.1 immunoglobulin light chain junction region [Macaca mulatta]MOV68216.1 immunoglobulin light chain junction region [Macaca mulatta]
DYYCQVWDSDSKWIF